MEMPKAPKRVLRPKRITMVAPKRRKLFLQPGVFSNQGTQTENGQGNIQSVCQADTDHAC